MTVSSTTTYREATGDGSTTIFSYAFKIFASSDLEVYVSGVLQTLTTHYSVSGVGESTGGNVTFVTAPASSAPVRIVRAVPYTQATDYVENDPFPADTHEDVADKLTMLALQLKEITDRAPKFSTASSVRSITFPEGASASNRASKIVLWNSAGTDLTLSTAGSLGTLVVGVDVQAWDADLDAVAGLTTAGLIARTGAGTAAARTITADSNISVSNGDGASGNPTIKWLGMSFAADATVGASAHTLNVNAGSGISVAVQANSAGTGRADLYISARGIAVAESGTVAGVRQTLNFIEGTGTSITVADSSAGTGRVDVTIATTSSVSAASQAQMEAASDNTVYAPPGRVQNHPGVAKSWNQHNNAGTVGASYNVTSITDTGTGNHTITYTTAMSNSANNVLTGAPNDNTGGGVYTSLERNATTNYLQKHRSADSAFALADPGSDEWQSAAFGDQ